MFLLNVKIKILLKCRFSLFAILDFLLKQLATFLTLTSSLIKSTFTPKLTCHAISSNFAGEFQPKSFLGYEMAIELDGITSGSSVQPGRHISS